MEGLNIYLHSFFWKDSVHINDSKAFWKGKVASLRAMKEYGGIDIYLHSFLTWHYHVFSTILCHKHRYGTES